MASLKRILDMEMRDNSALQKAYSDYERCRRLYTKLMKQHRDYINIVHWKAHFRKTSIQKSKRKETKFSSDMEIFEESMIEEIILPETEEGSFGIEEIVSPEMEVLPRMKMSPKAKEALPEMEELSSEMEEVLLGTKEESEVKKVFPEMDETISKSIIGIESEGTILEEDILSEYIEEEGEEQVGEEQESEEQLAEQESERMEKESEGVELESEGVEQESEQQEEEEELAKSYSEVEEEEEMVESEIIKPPKPKRRIRKRKTIKKEQLPVINSYEIFLKKLEESESDRLATLQFQRDAEELTKKFCETPCDSKGNKAFADDSWIKSVIDAAVGTHKFLFDERKVHPEQNIPINIRELYPVPSELQHKASKAQIQLTLRERFPAHYLDVNSQKKYQMAWYLESTKWFKKEGKDEFQN